MSHVTFMKSWNGPRAFRWPFREPQGFLATPCTPRGLSVTYKFEFLLFVQKITVNWGRTGSNKVILGQSGSIKVILGQKRLKRVKKGWNIHQIFRILFEILMTSSSLRSTFRSVIDHFRGIYCTSKRWWLIGILKSDFRPNVTLLNTFAYFH